MRRIAALATILTLGATACGGDGDLSTRLAMRPLGGTVEVRDGGSWESVSDDTMIALGSEVRTGDDGWAVVDLPRNQTVELAPGTSLAVTQTSTSKLMTGSVLVRAPAAVGIQLQDAEVRGVGGTFRVDRGFQDQVRVYEGVATIPGSGWDGEVPPLREVVVVAGSVPRAPQPVTVDPAHRWDERLFQGAIEIGLSLERLEKGLDRQFPSKRVRDVVAGATPEPVPVRMVRGQLAARPLGQWSEVMVAAVLASRSEGVLPVEEALLRVLALRDLGASWIVIAAELGITETVLAAIGQVSGLLARVVEAFVSAPSGPASGGGPGAPPVGSSSAPTGDGGNGDGGNDGGGNDDGGSDDGASDVNPPPEPEPEPEPDPDPPCALGELICGIGEEALGGELPSILDP